LVIEDALGLNAFVDDIHADFAYTACPCAILAPARVAGFFPAAKRAVVAVVIEGALGVRACVDDVDADFVSNAGGRALLTLARIARLVTVTEKAVAAVGIDAALGVGLTCSVCWITLLTSGTLHGHIGATGL
jgi:hypothetical protein